MSSINIMKNQKKEFGIYHWDTFDNTTFMITEMNTLVKAEDYVFDHYNISDNGADQVDIVKKGGIVVKKFRVTGSK